MVITVKERQLKNGVYEVEVQNLPPFGELQVEVNAVIKRMTWLEKYGWDWLHNCVAFAAIATGYYLLSLPGALNLITGMLIHGWGHTVITVKSGHLASHGAQCVSPAANRFLMWFFVEFIGIFSHEAGIDSHIKGHHPHTNIVGLGDSSIWKVPILPRFLYMYVTPLLLNVVTPFVSLKLLWGKWIQLMRFVLVAIVSLSIFLYPLVNWFGYTLLQAIVVLGLSRSCFSVPYIHINIFQHIGQPMYANSKRPARLYQMTSGVLNLARNPVLDGTFGHSLVNCHVEHHLFPKFSDQMCLAAKPIVRKFLEKHGLPYKEEEYGHCLQLFYNDYERLMVNAPPITHYVGLQ